VLKKPTESEDVSKYTSIWKICIGENFSAKISGNFPDEISGLTTLMPTLLTCKQLAGLERLQKSVTMTYDPVIKMR